jgi:hypothetical protein
MRFNEASAIYGPFGAFLSVVFQLQFGSQQAEKSNIP